MNSWDINASGRKHSKLVLDEAVVLAGKFGLRRASQMTGIADKTIRHHKRSMLLKSGKWERGNARGRAKYTHAQKWACVKLALKILKGGFAHGMRPAFIMAGEKLGVNGRSIEYQYQQGDFWGDSPLIQQRAPLKRGRFTSKSWTEIRASDPRPKCWRPQARSK